MADLALLQVCLERALSGADKRGAGLSDPTTGLPTIDERVNDLLAVMTAARSRREIVLGLSEGARTAFAFGVLHPKRTLALVLYGTSYQTPPRSRRMRSLQSMLRHWGEGRIVDIFAPSIASAEVRRAAGVFELPRPARQWRGQ